MPNLDVLLLPLFGGFFFAIRFYYTRYQTLRAEGYRLVFTVTFIGALLFAVATLIIHYLLEFGTFQSIQIWKNRVYPVTHLGKGVLALLLGLTLWWPLNRLGEHGIVPRLRSEAILRREIAQKGDAIELLLLNAYTRDIPALLTLRNNKVYVGRLQELPLRFTPVESISLVLVKSGHRDPNTKAVIFDVNYDETHKAIKQAAEKKLTEALQEAKVRGLDRDAAVKFAYASLHNTNLEQFQIVIPIAEIVSYQQFDEAIYKVYFDLQQG